MGMLWEWASGSWKMVSGWGHSVDKGMAQEGQGPVEGKADISD